MLATLNQSAGDLGILKRQQALDECKICAAMSAIKHWPTVRFPAVSLAVLRVTVSYC